MRKGGFWFKLKVLSFKIRFCNGDSDAHLTSATAHAQTLCVMAGGISLTPFREQIERKDKIINNEFRCELV
jgi:hypothetical protein